MKFVGRIEIAAHMYLADDGNLYLRLINLEEGLGTWIRCDANAEHVFAGVSIETCEELTKAQKAYHGVGNMSESEDGGEPC